MVAYARLKYSYTLVGTGISTNFHTLGLFGGSEDIHLGNENGRLLFQSLFAKLVQGSPLTRRRLT